MDIWFSCIASWQLMLGWTRQDVGNKSTSNHHLSSQIINILQTSGLVRLSNFILKLIQYMYLSFMYKYPVFNINKTGSIKNHRSEILLELFVREKRRGWSRWRLIFNILYKLYYYTQPAYLQQISDKMSRKRVKGGFHSLIMENGTVQVCRLEVVGGGPSPAPTWIIKLQ